MRDSGPITGKTDKRRPLAVAAALVGVISAALIAPVFIDGREGRPTGSAVRADSRDLVAINSPLTLFNSPSVVLEKGTVSLAGDAGGESRVSAVLRALVSGSGVDLAVDNARLVVDRRANAGGSTLPSDTHVTSAHVASAADALGPVVSTLAGFSFRSLKLASTTLIIFTADGAREKLSNVDATITNRNGLLTAKGRLEWRGEPLDFDIATTAPPQTDTADAASDKPLVVRANVKGALLSIAFDGKTAPGDRGQITAETAELSISDVRRAASWIGLPWTAGPGLGPFTAKGRLALDERSIAFEEAQFVLDGNAASGALRAAIGSERPSLEGTLAFAAFDLAPYENASRADALTAATDWLAALRVPGFASKPPLRAFDADVRVSAANVMNGSDRLGRGAISLALKDGKLNGEIAELELDQGGTGQGQFSADMSGYEPRYTLRAQLNDVDMAKVIGPRLGRAALDGNGDLALDITANGANEADILGSISGTIALDMPEGGRVGLALDALRRSADVPGGQVGWGPVGEGGTAVDTFNARVKATDGVFDATGVIAKLDGRDVRVTGSIDVDRTDLDLVLSIVAAPGTVADPSKPAGAYRLKGPWSAPTIAPAEPGKAAGGAQSSAANPG